MIDLVNVTSLSLLTPHRICAPKRTSQLYVLVYGSCKIRYGMYFLPPITQIVI